MPNENRPQAPGSWTLVHDPTRLRRRRYECGLSQKDLAKKVQMAPSTISELEHGRRNANAVSLARLAAGLDCQPSDLMPPAA